MKANGEVLDLDRSGKIFYAPARQLATSMLKMELRCDRLSAIRGCAHSIMRREAQLLILDFSLL